MAGPQPATKKRRAMDVLKALSRPRVAVMLALGFSSGLPFMLIGNTLGYWLSEGGVKLSAIGYLSWAGLPYLFKFAWGALVDRTDAPLIGKTLGRRRGWMIVTQVMMGAGLIGMAAVGAGQMQLGWLAVFAVLTGVAAAMQDTVIDAWRIEIAQDPDELGLLTAAYTLGFRAALIATEALILIIATAVGWAASYAIYGLLAGVGVAAALFAAEPARADDVMAEKSEKKPLWRLSGAVDAVVGPFVAFFRTHGVGAALLMLGMITLYHLCDYMRGPVVNPYYHDLGITKPTVALVRTTFGLGGSLLGVAVGGLSSLRLGNHRTLIIGAFIQPIGVGVFALLGLHGGDYPLLAAGPLQLSAFQGFMAVDAFAIGFSGVALVAYMSTLTSLGYTATQYALLTSALVWTGKILKGFSGAIVERLSQGQDLLHAYAVFFGLSAAIGVPAIILCLILAMRPERKAQAAPV